MSKHRPAPPDHVWKFPDPIRRWLLDPGRTVDHYVYEGWLYCATKYGSIKLDPRHPDKHCRLCKEPIDLQDVPPDREQARG